MALFVFLVGLQTIPGAFKKHIEVRNENKTAKLRSNASERTWELKMDGLRFARGWEEFAVAHDLQAGDMLLFRHQGNMMFYVTAYGPNRCEIQYYFSRRDVDEDNGEDNNVGDHSRQKKAKKSSEEIGSNHSRFKAPVTSSGLQGDELTVPMDFARSNGLNDKRRREIVLMNERGKSWTLNLRFPRSSGKVYIKRGWKSFCCANGLHAGDSCKLELVRNGGKPILRLSPTERGERSSEKEERSESKASEEESYSTRPRSENNYILGECSKRKAKKTRSKWKPSASPEENKFVTLTVTPAGWRSQQLFLSVAFRWHGIEKPCEITLLDKGGTKWPSFLLQVKDCETFYTRRNLRKFFEANSVKNGDSLMLKLLWDNFIPTLHFCSNINSIN